MNIDINVCLYYVYDFRSLVSSLKVATNRGSSSTASFAARTHLPSPTTKVFAQIGTVNDLGHQSCLSEAFGLVVKRVNYLEYRVIIFLNFVERF